MANQKYKEIHLLSQQPKDPNDSQIQGVGINLALIITVEAGTPAKSLALAKRTGLHSMVFLTLLLL